MKFESPKEYLSQIKYLDNEIDCLLESSYLNRNLAMSTSKPIDDVRVQTSGVSDFTNSIDKAIDLEMKANKKIDDLIDLKTNITKEIMSLEDSTHRILLFKRYFMYKDLKSIAKELKYSFDWIKHLHGHALEAFRVKYPDKFKKKQGKN